MDGTQLQKRVGEAEFIAIGRLDNHKLVFNRKGSYRSGGVASVAPSSKGEVFGVVWRLASTALNKLDAIEDPEAYVRVAMPIDTTDGRRLLCQVYESIPVKDMKPDPDYLDLIVDAAKRIGLPVDYIRSLEAHRAKA